MCRTSPSTASHPCPPPSAPNRTSDELGLVAAEAPGYALSSNPVRRPNWSVQHDDELDAALARGPSTDNPGAVANVLHYPPLYYASLVPVYAATHAVGGSTLDAVTLMRVLGGLLAGVTVLALFAFLAELFPGRPAIAAGVALICAYQPVFTWIQAGVNPDALLILSARCSSGCSRAPGGVGSTCGPRPGWGSPSPPRC